MRLVDLPAVGNHFTWLNSSGSCRSRLCRFLLSDSLIDKWRITAQYVRDKDVSGHRPVWIKASHVNWGPKPFKVFSCWYKHPQFHDFVKSVWDSSAIGGDATNVLSVKLRLLRTRLWWWNTNVFGLIDLKIKDEVSKVNKIEDEVTWSGEEISDSDLNIKATALEAF
ncbi:unnamed protein product [Lathyrus sativus]|nr:unnamed protein product [Lathyrus sativus]